MSEAEQAQNASFTGTVAAFAAITMLFAALLSAYVVRRGISDDWANPKPDTAFYVSLIPGVMASVFAVRSRKRFHSVSVWITALAGLAFAGTQIAGWPSVQRNPSGDFILVFSAAVVVYAILASVATVSRPRSSVVAYHWHYLNAVWAFLLAFLSIWR